MGLGCLYIGTDHGDLTVANVEQLCSDMDGHTIEIWSQEQMDFLVQVLAQVETQLVGYNNSMFPRTVEAQ